MAFLAGLCISENSSRFMVSIAAEGRADREWKEESTVFLSHVLEAALVYPEINLVLSSFLQTLLDELVVVRNLEKIANVRVGRTQILQSFLGKCPRGNDDQMDRKIVGDIELPEIFEAD